MDYQKELILFLEYFAPNQSQDVRDAVELDASFHVINVPKLLAVKGLSENYVFRLKDSWNAWKAAKAQAVPEWISVEDGLPSDGQNIIAFDAIKHCVFKDGEFLQGYIESDTGHEYEEPVEVTHWMAVEAQEPAND